MANSKKKKKRSSRPSCINCYPIRKDADWDTLSQSSSSSFSSELESFSKGAANVGIGVGQSERRSLSYHRLPEPHLRLSILKLDDTSFEVKIAMTATVGELKIAVENVFRDRKEEDGGMISWSHVWSHFCLCYQDFKLLDDKLHLKHFGIKDGDQIEFRRHLSLKSYPIMQQPKNHEVAKTQEAIIDENVMRLAGPEPEVATEITEDTISNQSYVATPIHSSQEKQHDYFDSDAQENMKTRSVAHGELKLARRLRRWLSSSRLGSPHKSSKLEEEKVRLSKPGRYF